LLSLLAVCHVFSARCPFCQSAAYNAEYKGPLTKEARDKEEEEERRVKELELQIRFVDILFELSVNCFSP